MRRCLVLCLVLAVLAGCGTLNPYNEDFDCKGYPNGVNCTSAREVYRLTDYKDYLTPEDKDDKKGKKGQKEGQPVPAAPAVNHSVNPTVDPATAAVQGMSYEGPIPIRTSPQVMRIWLAPWESIEGALNMPSYLYVEVVERKWSVGEAKMEVAPQITPLQQVEAPDAVEAPPRPARTQQRKTPPRPSRPTAPEKSKAIPQLQGFNRPSGEKPQQNIFPKVLPEGF